ncbi:GntR family transcriptional regulator [Castellaniella caeni]|uniref:GntR family transcriptional regulator n=1 Tax=Castellaniella caeni TaxID=266123 RepID=UPI00082B5509|nr:GntR family transcriptional regulator [Castellaniella caeni]
MKDILLADQAFQAVRGLLLDGSVRAGQLVSVAELVEATGLPLAPVREAVKHAESVGLMQILPRRGILVIEPVPQTVLACFNLRYLFDQEGARLLALHQQVDALAALRQQHVDVRQQAAREITPELQHRAIEVDWQLHQSLAQALDNPLAIKAYTNNLDRIIVLQRSRRLLPERIIPAMDEHMKIIDAVLDGQAEEAMQAVRDHLSGTLRWWGVLNAF